METEERKRLNRERRLKFILDKAETLVFSKGFEGMTMDDIAKASGYTKRSVYLYFKDRDEVFFSLALRGQRLLLAALGEAASLASHEAVSAVRLFGMAFYRFSLAHPEYFELIMAYEAKRHAYTLGRVDGETLAAACHNISVEYGEILSLALSRDIDEGRMRTDLDPRQTLMMLWGQVFGVMQILLMRREAFESVYGLAPEAFFERFIEQLERGLAIS